MANLYADEDFSYPVVEELRRLGHDVLTAHEAGQANQSIPDPVVLAFGTLHKRAVLTFNRKHFLRLSRAVALHAGIIACTRDDDVTALANRISAQITLELSTSPDLTNEALVYGSDDVLVRHPDNTIATEEFRHDDPRWPVQCPCGFTFSPNAARQTFFLEIYLTPDGKPVTTHPSPAETFPTLVPCGTRTGSHGRDRTDTL